MEVVLHKIRGLGGIVFKTNADLERAKLIQSALAATAGKESNSRKNRSELMTSVHDLTYDLLRRHGVEGVGAATAEELKQALTTALGSQTPTLIEVPTLPDGF